MSYKYKVLQDRPLAFYMLEEVRSGNALDYNNILTQFSTYQDLKDNGVSYATLSGMPVWDSSGNGYDGFGTDASDHELMPIISGAIRGTEILSNTQLNFPVRGIANKDYSDDEFSIEIWASLPKNTTSRIHLIGDEDNNIGLFYENGTITFSVQSESIHATSIPTEALYIVGVFSSRSISLYIDGVLLRSKFLDNFSFTNTSVAFSTQGGPDSFVIDGLAFYKKALTPRQIESHFNYGNVETPMSQIVYPDQGTLFSLNANKTRYSYEYQYPKAKPWNYFADENVKISEDQSYIYIERTEDPTEKSFSFTDSITVPNYMDLVSSQIYWDNDSYGITVEASIDDTVWVECTNGMPIPFFNKNENNFADILYIRVSMNSEDTTKYFPILKNIRILFFSDKDCYGDNSGYRVYSDYDYGIAHENHLNLSYCKMQGLSMLDGHGFSIDYSDEMKTIELIFTPDGGENILLSTENSEYGWDADGTPILNNINSVHVNSIDVTLDTNISDHFLPGYPYHVVISLGDNPGSNLKFNQNQNDTISGGSNMYSNIAIYADQLTDEEIHDHYLLITDRYSTSVSDTSISLSELDSGQDSTSFYIVEFEPSGTNI